MAYLKRNKIGKFWPVPRKGTKYLALAAHNENQSIPLVVVMRDILKIIKNKKELKKILNEKQILINHKIIKEINCPVCMFDIISFPKIKKNYRAILGNNKKINFEEISGENTNTKIYKVTGKTILDGGEIQLNLMQGRNIITKEKINTGDSIVFDLKENKILKLIPLEKNRTVFALKGKHAGNSGEIIDIVNRGGKKIAKILVHGKKLNIWTKNVIAIK